MKEFVLTGTTGSPKIEYAKELNPEQLDVVLRGDGPCLVLAGAGSGKTRTITYRVAYLLEHGIPADQILLVTFTNKAAREMLSRVEGLLGASLKGLWGGTFHSVANRILRLYAPQLGHTANFTIIDQEDGRDLMKVCIKDLNIDTTARRFPSPANLQSMVSYARNASRSMRDVVENKHPNFIDLIPTIERIAELYENRKRSSDALDFDDLLIRLRDLLYQHADVRDRLANQFRYILVDEYQDTNTIQAEIVRQLASVHRNLLVVGDDAQSIYSFRAAEIRNILQFPDQYSEARVFHLTTNYRSSPQILEVANAVIKQNRDQFKKNLKAVRAASEKPSVIPAASAIQEAQYIAEQMLRLRDKGLALSSMAVLFRAAFHSQALEFELMKRDIPYEYRGGMKFFERAHIKDVVAHARVLANPRDEMAWMRVLGLYGGIGFTTAGKIVEALRGIGTLEEILQTTPSLSSRAAHSWQQCTVLFKKVLAAGAHPSDRLRAIIAHGYREYLEAEYPDFMDRLEDLEQFALFSESYTELKVLLDEVSLTDGYGAARAGADPSSKEDRVVLSTIHQAKGLEWAAVFVMHLVESKFPSARALGEAGGLEEERRLFYVAATRARERLFLSYPIMGGDTLVLNQPSCFLQEIPKGAVEEIKLRSATITPSWTPSRREREDEPTIVLDAQGEKSREAGSGSAGKASMSPAGRDPGARDFLRDVNEL